MIQFIEEVKSKYLKVALAIASVFFLAVAFSFFVGPKNTLAHHNVCNTNNDCVLGHLGLPASCIDWSSSQCVNNSCTTPYYPNGYTQGYSGGYPTCSPPAGNISNNQGYTCCNGAMVSTYATCGPLTPGYTVNRYCDANNADDVIWSITDPANNPSGACTWDTSKTLPTTEGGGQCSTCNLSPAACSSPPPGPPPGPPPPPPPPPPAPGECTIQANPTSGEGSVSGTLTWESNNCSWLRASGGWMGNKNANDSESFGPITTDTFYNLECYYGGNIQVCTANVSVTPPACPTSGNRVLLNPGSITVGSTAIATAPSGYTNPGGARFYSNNSAVASVNSSVPGTVTGVTPGSTTIYGTGFNYSNGATNCSLAATSISVTPSVGRIQGTKRKMPGNQPGQTPPSTETIRLDGGSPITTEVYSYNNVSSGNHTVTTTVPAGYSVGYTLCYNVTTCHGNAPTAGSSVVVNVPAGGYADLWWHYTPLSAPSISLNPTSFTFSGVSNSGSAPASQNLTISNPAAGSTLLWRAQTNQNWCRVNGTNNSGSITGSSPNGSPATVAVTVDQPSNVGSFSCTITVSDNGSSPAATNSPQAASVTYNVTPGPVDGIGGTSFSVSQATCPTTGVVLSWTPGAGATSYRIYRHTSDSFGAATLLTTQAAQNGNVGNQTYTNSTTGGPYFYWVVSVNGAFVGQQAPASTNTSGGISANTCPVPPNGGVGPGPTYNKNTDPAAIAQCDQVRITWVDNSTNETGFKLYKDGVYFTTVATANQAGTGVTQSYTYTPGDTNPHDYSYSATNTAGDSATVSSSTTGVAAVSCEGSLSTSDKDIVGRNTSTWTNGDCDSFQQNSTPISSFANGDAIKFEINFCNTGFSNVTTIRVLDTLTNLVRYDANQTITTAAAWNAQLTGGLTFQNPPITVMSGTEAAGNLVIRFNINGSIAPAGSAKLTFWAKTAFPSTFVGSTTRFQNSARITFNGPSANFKDVSTPLLLFSRAIIPDRGEVSP